MRRQRRYLYNDVVKPSRIMKSINLAAQLKRLLELMPSPLRVSFPNLPSEIQAERFLPQGRANGR